jgi:drug/metabolite transporter (DMT)-like permease
MSYQREPTGNNRGWLLLSVIVQSLIGASMVPVRYLQTVAGFPSLGIMGIADLLAFSVMAWWLIPKIRKRDFRSKTLWIMVTIVVFRTITLTLANRFTTTYIVQLINLLAPFMVVLFDRFVNHSKLPKFTIPAITLSLIGGGLIIFGEIRDQPLADLLTPMDELGLILALIGTVGIAAYMVIIKHGKQVGLPFEVVYISQVGTMAVLMTGISLGVGENWQAFRTINWQSGLALAFIAFGMEVGLKVGNITTLRKLGAPLVSSMLAVRLVAAIFLGWLILGEKPETLLQWIGTAIVVVTISWYLSQQTGIEV